jgi:hypothetical protein
VPTLMVGRTRAGTIRGMTIPTVTELPQAVQPVTPPTFVFMAVRDGAPRPATPSVAANRRIVD